MTTTEIVADRPAEIGGATALSVGRERGVSVLASAKIADSHRQRLAVVYVRQSTPQQMVDHRESLARQYALVDHATALGWFSDRVLLIDEDLGISGRTAEDRAGFQRLLTEVTLDHVGMVLGLEMSRLARSNKDWHHLLELCGIFGTLLADQDGVYDPADPNDRLVLGLKGTMSELELHTMQNRLGRGKLNKAQRGELFLHAPVGYVKTSDGGIAVDPDEQVRSVIHLIFDKFDELGSGHAVHRYLLKQKILLGIRAIDGPNRGQLEWRSPTSALLFSILNHPMYAGAYVYGRCPVDPKRRHARRCRRRWVSPDEWKVLLRDRVPAYITWDRYVLNQKRLKDNRARRESRGYPRRGEGLLAGLVVCGRCGHRFRTVYGKAGHPRYDCDSYLRDLIENPCRGLSGGSLDALVSQQVLRALEPAAIELSVQAVENIHQERERLAKHWRQQVERAQYEARRAERHYRAVDPENRLVARTLEQQWEVALREQRQLEEEFTRFRSETPARLTSEEHEHIRALAKDLPALWQSPRTSVADRKEIIRCLVDRVTVNIRGDSEHVDVAIHWSGGYVSQHEIVRPVGRYEQLGDYDRILARIREGREQSLTATQIADRLNREGFHSPATRRHTFTKIVINNMASRLGHRKPLLASHALETNQWWLPNLADELKINIRRLYHWVTKGYVHAWKSPESKFWILWADQEELTRLTRLRDYLQAEHHVPYPSELTQPKPRMNQTGSAGHPSQEEPGTIS